jgi:aryl-alcohol dehydrogenase-like predicted oxidoreductase
LHQPDGVTPIEETLSALTELVREGKVRYIGCSNFDGWQIADASWTARTSGLEAFSPGILPFFPLEYGLLTGKYRRGSGAPTGSRAALDPTRAQWLDAADWDRIEAMEQYAEARGLGVLDVAIAGLAAQPAVASVISGATSGDQVRTNAAALRWVPTAEDLVELDEITAT